MGMGHLVARKLQAERLRRVIWVLLLFNGLALAGQSWQASLTTLQTLGTAVRP